MLSLKLEKQQGWEWEAYSILATHVKAVIWLRIVNSELIVQATLRLLCEMNVNMIVLIAKELKVVESTLRGYGGKKYNGRKQERKRCLAKRLYWCEICIN